MTTLSVWPFGTPHGAESALRTLERLQYRGRITVDDIAVAAWSGEAERPRTYQVATVAGTAAALSGAFWGLLFALVFLLPLAGVAGPDAAVLSRLGLSAQLLERLRARLVPGTSALFLLSSDAELERLGDAIADGDTAPLLARLSLAEEATLRQAFDADDLSTR